MTDNLKQTIILTGLAGVVASIAWTVGDALLLGNTATAEQYPILAKYAGGTDLASQVVQAGAQFFGSSPERLAAGALLAVLTTPLYLAGVWHIYLALRPAGKWSALGPMLLLVAGYCFAPFVHGSFYYLAEMIKLLPNLDSPAQTQVLEAATRSATILFGTYGVLATVTIAGLVWMIVTVARGGSLYPRWVAVANPILFMIIGSVIDRVLPYPLSLWLEGAGLNLGMLFFFALSLIVLWKKHPQAEP